MAKWYVVVSGATHELEWDALKLWATQGRLSPSDPVRSATEENWRTVGDVPELVRLFPPRPPGGTPAPPFPTPQPPQPSWAVPNQPRWMPPPSPPKSSKGLIIGAIIGVAVLVAVSVGLVGFVIRMERKKQTLNTISEKGNATVLTATDQTCQITLPVGWTTATGLNKLAVVQARNVREDLYLVISGEVIPEDAEVDLEKFSDGCTEFFEQNYSDAKVASPIPVTVAGRDAISRDITFTGENVKMRGLHIVTATADHAYQIFLWSTTTGFARNNQFLREMPLTFRPIGKTELDAEKASVTVEITGDGNRKLGSYRFLNDGRAISLASSVKTLDKADAVETVTIPKTALPLDLTVNGRKFRMTEKMLAETGCQWNATGETPVPVFLAASSGVISSPPKKVNTKKVR